MIPFLAVAVLSQRAPDDALPTFHTALEVAKTLGSLGYPYKSTGENSATGEISKGAAVVWVSVVRTVGDSANGVPDTYPIITLQIEMAAPRAISTEPIDAFHNVHFQKSAVAFTPHLGGTITETETIVFSSLKTRKELKAALDGFFEEGNAFAKAFGIRFAAWAPVPDERMRFDDGLKLDRADQKSLERATASWGWKASLPFGYASQGWMFPMTVRGKSIWLRQATAGTDALPRAIEVVRYSNEPAPDDWWQKAQATGETMPSAIYSDGAAHTVASKASIDLTKGVSLGELRRRIAEFASDQP